MRLVLFFPLILAIQLKQLFAIQTPTFIEIKFTVYSNCIEV